MEDKHEHHHWLIAILSVCVLALTGVVAFFGYELFYGDHVVNITRVEVTDQSLDNTLETQRADLEQYLNGQQ
jgi:hypothetical protein